MGGPFLVTHAVLRTPDDPVRFGYVISKKVGNAVTRNLLRRRLKGISEELIRDGIVGADIVFRALPDAATTRYVDLKAEVTRHMERISKWQHRNREQGQKA